MKLLTAAQNNAKTAKNVKFDNYLSYILHLAPSTVSGYQTCPFASEGCKQACLNTAGRGVFSNVQAARIRKTKLFFEHRSEFLGLLVADLRAVIRKSAKLGKVPVVRLNGTSDIAWERVCIDGRNLFELFPMIQFYDYTKNIKRLKMFSLAPISNYHLTFSQSESNRGECLEALRLGFNVATVFRQVPPTYLGQSVVSGEDSDLRFLDPRGVVVGLTAKGRAKCDSTGFVI